MCRVLTLLYHRVKKMEYDRQLLAVTPDNFYDQMLYLKKNYSIVRFEDDWDSLAGHAVCITFDDGYMDNFTEALPILEDLDIPATVFVATGTLNTTREFWWDELESLLLDREKVYEKLFKLKDEIYSYRWCTESYKNREDLYETLHWLMYDKISVNKREDWLDQLRRWCGKSEKGREENYGLQIDEINKDAPLLTIGAHTVNHPSLKKLPKQEQYQEIKQSIKRLEELFERKIDVFSYPFGTENDFDETTIDICRDMQIRKAAANIPGLWKPGCDAYKIPRNIVRDWCIDEYIQKIKEFWKLR